jgi:hypothetical protein
MPIIPVFFDAWAVFETLKDLLEASVAASPRDDFGHESGAGEALGCASLS